MDRAELKRQVKQALDESEAFLELEEGLRLNTIKMLEFSSDEKLAELLNLLKEGNRSVSQTQLLLKEGRIDDSPVFKGLIDETNLLMQRGKTLGSSLQIHDEKNKSESAAESILDQLDSSI